VIIERRCLISRPLCENTRSAGTQFAVERKIGSSNGVNALRMTSERFAMSVMLKS